MKLHEQHSAVININIVHSCVDFRVDSFDLIFQKPSKKVRYVDRVIKDCSAT